MTKQPKSKEDLLNRLEDVLEEIEQQRPGTIERSLIRLYNEADNDHDRGIWQGGLEALYGTGEDNDEQG